MEKDGTPADAAANDSTGRSAPACPEDLLEASLREGSGDKIPGECLDVYRGREADRFAGLISSKGASKLQSEWHKPGAPYLENPGPKAPTLPAPKDMPGKTVGAGMASPAPSGMPGAPPAVQTPIAAAAEPPAQDTAAGAGPKSPADESPYKVPDWMREGSAGPGKPGLAEMLEAIRSSRLAGAVDMATLEITALTMFRAMFGQGVAIPVRREGLVDMDIIVMGKDIVLNTNRLMLELPELTIWRIIFAYKGRPILEYGRGIPGKVKLHKFRALQLAIGMWWNGRNRRADQAERISGRALALMAKREQKKRARRLERETEDGLLTAPGAPVLDSADPPARPG